MNTTEKKSMVDLLDKSISEENEMESAVKKIHQKALKAQNEKTVRATIDLPANFHKELKKYLIDESLDLKTFYLMAIQEKYERLTASPENRSN